MNETVHQNSHVGVVHFRPFYFLGIFSATHSFCRKSAIIDAPAKVVFAQINDLYNWEKWSKWHQIDPEMQLNYINHGVGEGAGYSWESNNRKAGSGQLLITRIGSL